MIAGPKNGATPVQTAVTRAGTYQIRARLASGATALAYSYGSEPLPLSTSHFIDLVFDGAQVGSAGLPGPYNLAELEIFDAAGGRVLREIDAHQTEAYTSSQFGAPLVTAAGTPSLVALDTNANNQFDSLQVSVPILASQRGTIIAVADLVASDGTVIEHRVEMLSLASSGVHSIPIMFSGRRIYSAGRDGPYGVANVLIYHSNTTATGLEVDPIATSAYIASAFEPARGIIGTVSDLAAGEVFGVTLVVGSTSEIAYTTPTGDYWLYVPESTGDSVTVLLVDTPALGPGQWGAIVDGAYVAEGTTARIHVAPNTRETLDFVHGETVAALTVPAVRFAAQLAGMHPTRGGGPIRLRLKTGAPMSVVISLVAVSGRRIATWPPQSLLGGDSEVLLDPAEQGLLKLPAGLYFIRLAWEDKDGLGGHQVLKLVVVDG